MLITNVQRGADSIYISLLFRDAGPGRWRIGAGAARCDLDGAIVGTQIVESAAPGKFMCLGGQFNRQLFFSESGPEPDPIHVWSFETCLNL